MPKPPYAPPNRSSNSAWNTSLRSIGDWIGVRWLGKRSAW
jgi:hypothetical protein